jgi:hypothetical protein
VQEPGAVFETMLDGQVMAGFSVSLTVTEKLQLAVRPDESVAVQLTVLVPLLNVEPLAGLHTTVGAGVQLSVAVTVYVAVAVHRPGSVLLVMLDGHTIDGA